MDDFVVNYKHFSCSLLFSTVIFSSLVLCEIRREYIYIISVDLLLRLCYKALEGPQYPSRLRRIALLIS